MSYRGWKNWATYACVCHFERNMRDIFQKSVMSSHGTILISEYDAYMIFKEGLQKLVEMEAANPELPSGELADYLKEIDYYELFSSFWCEVAPDDFV